MASIDTTLTELLDRRIQDSVLQQALAFFPKEEHEHLLEQVEDLARRLNSLVEATQKAREPLSLDLMLTRMVKLITEAFGADRSSLFLYDAETDELFSRVAQGDLFDEIRFSADCGIAGSVFRNGLPATIDDAYADPRFNPEIDKATGYRTRNILCVPVRTRAGDVIGVSEVLNKKKGKFNVADAALLQAFTTHITTAVENAQLTERARATLNEQSRLMEVTQAISSELDIDKLLHKIMRIATELLDAERGTLFLYDPRADELWSRVAQGLDSKEIRIPSNVGIAGEVFTTHQAVNIPDAYADPRFNPEIDRITGYKTKTILCVPVINKYGVPVGVVQVLNHHGGVFNLRDQRRLEMLAAQSAIALDNARLFRDVLDERNYSENLLGSLTNGVIALDLLGNIVKVNAAASRILCLAPKDILGASAKQIFSNGNEWICAAIDGVITTLKPDTVLDANLSTPHGGSVTVNLNVGPLLDIECSPIGFTLVIEDITREKRIRSTMARYMTREVAEQVLEQEETVLGGRSQEVTILFTDIKDFTGISERIGAQETVSLLNEYFTAMVEVVFENGGTLDKYIGDAIMALFGAPFPTPRDADHAVRTAIQMQLMLGHLNAKRRQASLPLISVRIGINSDTVVAGNVGSVRRMDYTVIGDGVNLAARLETANNHFGTRILISGSTAAQLQDEYDMRELDLLRVKGKAIPIPIYEVLGWPGAPVTEEQQHFRQAFARGLEAYRKRNWHDAANAFALEARMDKRANNPSRVFLDRALHYMKSPPPDDWDGVWTLDKK